MASKPLQIRLNDDQWAMLEKLRQRLRQPDDVDDIVRPAEYTKTIVTALNLLAAQFELNFPPSTPEGRPPSQTRSE